LQTVSVVAEISGKQTFVAARTGRARQAWRTHRGELASAICRCGGSARLHRNYTRRWNSQPTRDGSHLGLCVGSTIWRWLPNQISV